MRPKKLPQLFLCQSLTSLKFLDISAEITTFDFVILKHLYLSGCWFELGMEPFFDPFKGCYYGKIEWFKISASKLTHLSILWMRMDEEFDSSWVIDLFIPKFQYFNYSDSDLYDFSIQVKLPFVEEVILPQAMGRAKFVSLSLGAIQVLSIWTGHLPAGFDLFGYEDIETISVWNLIILCTDSS
ncbi:hypothetical protein CR513_23318, partial [Mucuna pruriens]